MKVSREGETREAGKRVQGWRPPETLPSPEPIPGFEFRWIRCSIMGEPDPTNISSKRREGWEFVRAEDHPELMIPTTTNGKYAGLVETGGLVLAKIPTEFVNQRNAYYNNVAKSQTESVDNSYFKEEHPSMRMFKEGESKTTVGGFGNGRSR